MRVIARKVKCQGCGTPFERDEVNINYTKEAKGYYHIECFEPIRIEREQYAALVEYIMEKYNIPHPDGRMLRSLKEYRNERNYKYSGMLITLKYAFERLGMKADKKYGVGIIPYLYNEAKDDYIDRMKRLKNAAETINNEEIIVYVEKKDYKPRKKQIDMSQF